MTLASPQGIPPDVHASIGPLNGTRYTGDEREPALVMHAFACASRGLRWDDAFIECQELTRRTHEPPLHDVYVKVAVTKGYTRAAKESQQHKPREPRPDAPFVPEITLMKTIPVVDVEWLSYGRIQRAAINLLVGPPHAGKTYAALDCVAHLSKGLAWPPGSPREVAGPLHCLLLLTEDDLAAVIKPRLVALGADLNYVSVLKSMRAGDLRRPASLLQDREQLGDWIEAHEGGLFVVDPLFGALRSSRRYDSHNYADMVEVFTMLATWCEASRVTLLGIVHRKKSRSDRLLDDIQGSGALGAVPRCVSFIETEEDDEDEGSDRITRLLRTEKHSNAARPETRRFWLDPGPTPRACPSIRWDMEPVGRADERATFRADGAEASGARRSKTLLCAEWLLDTLTPASPVFAVDVHVIAEKRGWDQSIMHRASQHPLIRSRGYRIDKTTLLVEGRKRSQWTMQPC